MGVVDRLLKLFRRGRAPLTREEEARLQAEEQLDAQRRARIADDRRFGRF